jgi:hypothetical protein
MLLKKRERDEREERKEEKKEKKKIGHSQKSPHRGGERDI